jgi:hypothetical protein
MGTTKITLTLTAMLTILAITAATAIAATNFEGVGGTTTGSSQLKAGTGVVLRIGGAFPLVSSKAPDTWRIQDSKSEQRVTKKGPHLDQTVNFQEPSLVTPQGNIPVEINNPITYQYVIQPNGTLDIAVSKEATLGITLSANTKCTITIPASAANKQLTKINETISATSLEVKSEVEHITVEAEPAATCTSLGINSGAIGTLTQTTIEHGVTQV